jgi:thiosulfate/3-mercaptopyruvate sulfurtransferase
MVASMLVACGTSEAPEEVDREVFVEPEWVKSVIDGETEVEKYVLAEVSWGAYASAEGYNTAHVPGAIHINSDTVEYDDCDPWPMGDGIDDLAQYDTDFNYGENEVLPIDNFNIRSAEQLEAMMKHFGITEDTTVILYGNNASNSAVTRVAFAMLYAGVDHVKVMNGGFEAWQAAGYETETTVNIPTATEEDFGVQIPEHPEYIMSIEKVKENLENNEKFNLVSIRSYDEFIGATSGYGYITMAGEPEGAIWGKDTDDGTYVVDGKVVGADTLKQYGTVKDMINRGASDLYVIDTPNGEAMIPVVDEFIDRVDLKKGVFVRPIEGMFVTEDL